MKYKGCAKCKGVYEETEFESGKFVCKKCAAKADKEQNKQQQGKTNGN